MKKFMVLMLGLIFSWHAAYSQNIVQTWTENFDGTVSFSSIPANAWKTNSTYFMSAPYSYRGAIPNATGDSVVLTTPVYDFYTNACPFVQLRFNHICKVSPKDSIFIEYKITGSPWSRIPADAYMGGALANYRTSGGFNATSYPEWQVGDSTVLPLQSWWKEEIFDLREYVAYEMTQFRFIIKHGKTVGTQISYGWLLDNFEVTAATYEIKPPVVEFRSPFVKDTVYSTGPWEINAKVVTRTAARIENPWLKYTAILNGVVVANDSILMTHVAGDSLWKATIPQFLMGTDVTYSITGRDTTSNYSMIQSTYYIKQFCGGGAGGPNESLTTPTIANNGSGGVAFDIEVGSRPITITGFATSFATAGATTVHMYYRLGSVCGNCLSNAGWILIGQQAVTITTAGYGNNTYVPLPSSLMLLPGQTYGFYAIAPTSPGGSIQYTTGSSTCNATTVATNSNLTIKGGHGITTPTAPFTGGINTERNFGGTLYYTSGTGICDDNAVAVYSIDMPDTILVPPATSLPIVATIKNVGMFLDSVIVSYSLNNAAPISKKIYITPSLPWDFNYQDTLDYYYPKLNGRDTLVIWAEMPNGIVDTTTWDDTLTKIVYGSADIYAELISIPKDTVYTTGRYILKARIKSLTGSLPPISLYVAATYQGVTTYDTLPMILDMSDTLWKVSIPHYRFESDVAYSIELKDILGNDIVLSGGYHIKRVSCTTVGGSSLASEYFYTGQEEEITLFPGLYEIEVWGADGGDGLNATHTGGIGGKGGYSTGRLSITSATTLYIVVGERGENSSTGPSNGFGGNGGFGAGGGGGNAWMSGDASGGGGGGGLSGVFQNSVSFANALLIAGGGGGGGGSASGAASLNHGEGTIGGNGGGATGQDGSATLTGNGTPFIAGTTKTAANIGHGGTQVAGGASGGAPATPGGIFFGGGGYGVVGGIAGNGGTLAGGAGAKTPNTTSSAGGCGGGGGGYYGGGGSGQYGLGSGGGSGYINTSEVIDELTTNASQMDFISNPDITGNGYIRITPIAVSGDTGVCLDNSVAITAINSPVAARTGSVTAGILTPIQVTIRNRGVADLDSCLINWSLNGITQLGTTIYRGELTEDFSDTITIGWYIPTAGVYDTVRVWVSMPNGEVDSVTYDDTLRVTTRTCHAGGLSGDYIIGASGYFPTLDAAFSMLKECGMTGALRFLLENGTYTGPINISTMSNYMNAGNSFELTSLSGNALDVIIQSTGVGITIGNNRNISIRDLTIDVTSGTYGVNLTAACTNILVRDCRILSNPTTTSSAMAPIYKASGSVADSVFIINNLLDGGYYGIYFYGGTSSTAYGTHIVIDSNTISNQYYYALYSYYTDFISRSYNTLLSRTANNSTVWYGMHGYYTNGPVIGNRIIQRTTAITSPYGMYLYYFNYYFPNPNPDTSMIANNEIILYTTSTYYGMILYYAHAKVLHNSIYMAGTGAARGIYMQNVLYDIITLKNNNICMTSASAHPIYLSGVTNIAQYDIDYNNMYAPAYVGYAGMNVSSIASWQQIVTTDRNSVSVLPSFIDSTTSLELSTYNGLLCWSHPDVSTDINMETRATMTALGAYTQPASNQDLMLVSITPWQQEIVKDQKLSVQVNTINLGNIPITTAVLGWSINGVEQLPAIVWNPSPAVPTYDQRSIFIGTFPASGADTFHVVVWIKSINGVADSVNWNDTIRASAYIYPLAEFVAPFVTDTIFSLSFTVPVLIRAGTGAPASPPRMTIQSTVSGYAVLYDTISLTLNNGIWQAAIPQQYYGTKVVYSLTVSDTLTPGNSITLTDSTYIRYVKATGDSIRTVGTGTGTTAISPYYSNYDRGWTRAIYMNWELSPQRQGGYISSIAYFNTSATPSTVDNLSMYFRAVSDTIITTAIYQDPIANGATLVWGEGTNISYNGWNVFTLHTPFYLPPGTNLLVYWDNKDGSYTDNGTIPYWQYTTVANKHIRSYADGTAFPTTTNILIDGLRPNARFTFASSTEQYNGYDLGLLAVTEPVNAAGNACSNDYSSLKVAMGNLGTNDYDFLVNNVTLSVEVSGAISYKTDKLLTQGNLKSGAVDTIELTNLFPIYTPGQYDIKIWLTSAIDGVVYDDTLQASYISERIGLPIDVDFSAGIPNEFTSQAINSAYSWETNPQGVGTDTTVLPVFGTGLLSFNGTKGAMTYLSSRQLELRGTALPTLEFWYFHDTIESEDYMDVRITTDGGNSYTLLQSVVKQNAVYGWQRYEIDLTPYVSGQCINLVFEAMTVSFTGGAQYIDRIRINSQQDLAVSQILLPELTACDLTNATVQIELSTVTNQAIDLAQDTTSLAVEIPGYPTFVFPLNKRIEGNGADTITLSNLNLSLGSYTIKAWLTTPVDNFHLNDTVRRTVTINPALSVRVLPQSGGNTDCLPGDVQSNPVVVITNTGNMPLSDLGLKLFVLVNSVSVDSILDTYSISNFMPGDSIEHTFASAYTIPWATFYGLVAEVHLQCNPSINSTGGISECVEGMDIAVKDILYPLTNQVDVAGSQQNITVLLENRSFLLDYQNVKITAVIRNSQAITTDSLSETIPFQIPFASDTTTYTFTSPYTVPNDALYSITVYITDVNDQYLDQYHYNDTLHATRPTDYEEIGIAETGIARISMSQNIPNPSNGTTRIDYSLPTDGEVTFHVYTISGQELFNQVVETTSGKHSIDLNTTHLASGIYFYSMEFKGQRIVKRMSVAL